MIDRARGLDRDRASNQVYGGIVPTDAMSKRSELMQSAGVVGANLQDLSIEPFRCRELTLSMKAGGLGKQGIGIHGVSSESDIPAWLQIPGDDAS